MPEVRLIERRFPRIVLARQRHFQSSRGRSPHFCVGAALVTTSVRSRYDRRSFLAICPPPVTKLILAIIFLASLPVKTIDGQKHVPT